MSRLPGSDPPKLARLSIHISASLEGCKPNTYHLKFFQFSLLKLYKLEFVNF